MSAGHEIDYGALIDRSIKDFQPTKRLWPIGARLVCWVLLEAAILGLAAWASGYTNLRPLQRSPYAAAAAGLFLAASIIAAFGALKSAVPGRPPGWRLLAVTLAMTAVAFGIELSGGPVDQTGTSTPPSILQMWSIAVLPWLSLFWAVRCGVPLQPELSGAAVGLAAWCFALALCAILNLPISLPGLGVTLLLSGAVFVSLSSLAGHWWLNWIARWQDQQNSTATPGRLSAAGARTVFPLALGSALAALLLVLQGLAQQFARIPDFDLTIDAYKQAIVDFRPNVPSTSMETMLTAYVEHGMPAYMWDFGPEGYSLVGGRRATLPGGTPVTYTWFRGVKGGVMCMFKQTAVFAPPSHAHDDHHHMLFYQYRGFSLCLINVGGYGNFISVIAAPMPLQSFEQLVLAATL